MKLYVLMIFIYQHSQQTNIYVFLMLSHTVFILHIRAKGRKPLNMKEGKPCPSASSFQFNSPGWLCLRYLNFTKAPKAFQSSHMYRLTPGAADSEQTLVDGGAVLLVCGDHRGQDTAIHQELHAQVFVLREQVRINYFLQNRFVISKLSSKCHKSSSYLSEAITV